MNAIQKFSMREIMANKGIKVTKYTVKKHKAK
jgi:hypothetical protein